MTIEQSVANTRRRFLIGGTALAISAACSAESETDAGAANTAPPDPARGRRDEMVRRRTSAATAHADRPDPVLARNGDEERFPDGLGSFTKTLPHDELGRVTQSDFAAMVTALDLGDLDAIDRIPSGGVRGLANPGAAHCYSLVGADPHSIDMPAVHSLASERQAAEAIEVYWMALLRDVAFDQYGTDEIAASASRELSAQADFSGPTVDGSITPATLFRGLTPGDLAGPYVSQFLLVDVPHGGYRLEQRAARPVEGHDFMTEPAEWLAVQNGQPTEASAGFESTGRFITTGRDLAEFVHADYSHQAYLNAALVCLAHGRGVLAPTPYSGRARQAPFVSYGAADVLDLVPRAAIAGLRPAWFHKWLVHRKLRPEAFGGRVHHQLGGRLDTPIDASVLESEAVARTADQFGSHLLPQAYPEGSPTHPSYPAGHATIAGSCVTVLKALFQEDFELPNTVEIADGGDELAAHAGAPLTLGGELNKLASNVAIGRNIAGVHWRADGDDGLVAGEEIALTLLQDHLYEVDADGTYELTRFSGERIRVSIDGVESI